MSEWISVESDPLKSDGLYIACSTHKDRDDFRVKGEYFDNDVQIHGATVKDLLCYYNLKDKTFQHVSGFYDHAITHYIRNFEPPKQ